MNKFLRVIQLAFLIVGILFMTGCTILEVDAEKLQDLEYTILRDETLPEEVQLLVQDNQENEMKMSYIDQGIEYIIIGYGAQETSGYSVEVLEVYETTNTLVVDTTLIGPMPDESIAEITTYPYIVIAIEESQKPIIYE